MEFRFKASATHTRGTSEAVDAAGWRCVGRLAASDSQQLRYSPGLAVIGPDELLDAAAPVLKVLAAEHDYRRLAVFGSVARGEARQDSDIDLLVEAPPDTSSFGFIRFTQLIEKVLGREIDLIFYGGLKPNLDDDIRRDAVLL